MQNKVNLAIIGFPLDHSRSPELHNYALNYHHIPGEYKKLSIKPGVFGQIVNELKNKDYRGFNITVPYKQKIIPYLDEIDPLAQRVNAVNTILVEEKRWIGYNTDVMGFIHPLSVLNIKINRALVIGAGGAAMAVCHALMDAYTDINLIIANRSEQRLRFLMAHLAQSGATQKVDAIYPLEAISREQPMVDLIVNATSIGMGDMRNTSPLDFSKLNHYPQIAYDLIYNPQQTPFLKSARNYGVGHCINGWPMLLNQADKSFQIWTGKTFPPALYSQHKKMENKD